MEDDIDIEEHDLLDNPKIRDIFPDLSLVKIERPDAEEETADQYNAPIEYHSDGEYAMKIKKEITSDEENNAPTAYTTSVHEETQHNSSEQPSSEHEETGENTYNYGETQLATYSLKNENEEVHFNKIILGSKPVPDYDTLYNEALHSFCAVYLVNWDVKLKNSLCFCDECETLFPTVNALDAHKSVAHSLLVALETPRPNTARKSTTIKSSRYCNHCDKMFPDDTSLIKHLYELLPLNDFRKPTPEPVKVDPNSTMYKCMECKINFATLAAGKAHKRSHHPTLENFNIICKVAPKTETPDLSIVKKEPEGKFFADDSLVPKAVLFQCNVCQINFVSCYSATQHAIRCRNNTEYRKCNVCKRKIRDKDYYLHTLQHRYASPGEKLRIYTLHKSMCEKVYLKCPKCSVCFDERSFWIHYKTCDGQRFNYKHCYICEIDIIQSRFPNHKSKHTMHKFTKKDFVIIKLYDVKRMNAAIKTEMEEFETLEKIVLYYCTVCRSYKTYPSERGHKDNSCANLDVKFCELCGLGFSRDNYKSHRNYHFDRQLTLNDFKVVNLKTGAEMEIPVSIFHECRRCKIYFLSRDKVRLHSCANEMFKVCDICFLKFNTRAFDAHLNFHTQSDIPELLKKYNSINDMWNVVYLCVSCDLATMSYDCAVEHCQDHINDLPKPSSKKCDVCEFEILDQDYKSHMQLHTNKLKIDRSKFIILSFDYENLYTDKWMSMFSTLPKAHKYQILSKSIYRHSRRFKLNCEMNYRSVEVKYFCKKCKTEVDDNEVKKHYFDKTCRQAAHYVCIYCDLPFNNLIDRVNHEQMHDNATKDYKIITFNDQKDELYDSRLKDFELSTAIKLPEFKPAKTMKRLPTKPQKKIVYKSIPKLKSFRPNTVRNEILKNNRMKLYKCDKCNSCVSLLKNIPKHKCCPFDQNRLKMCKICQENFHNSHLNLHMAIHKQFPKLNKKPLVIRFKPGTNSLPVANIFQCECGLHFTSRPTIEKHIEKCTDDIDISKEECSKCNLLFPTDVLVTHLCKHHSKPVDIRVQLVKRKSILHSVKKTDTLSICENKDAKLCRRCNKKFDAKNFAKHKCSKEKSGPVSLLFRCHECNVTFLNRKNISYHLQRNHIIRRDIVQCSICKLKFTAQSYERHRTVHSIENIVIKVSEPGTGRISILKGKNKKVVKENQVEKVKTESALSVAMDSDVDDTKQSVDDNKSKHSSYRVYRCHKCLACYIYKKRFDQHLDSDHTSKQELMSCDVCGLTFQKKALFRHMDIHKDANSEYVIETLESDTGKVTVHRGKNYDTNSSKRSSYFKDYSASRRKRPRRYRDDSSQNDSDDNYSQDEASTSKFGFESVDMNESGSQNPLDTSDPLTESILPDIDNTSTPKNNKTPHNISGKLKQLLDSNIRNYSKTLYKCKLCDLHFMTEGSVVWHITRDHNRRIPPNTCDICGIVFSFATLQRHIYIHHSKMNLSKDDFIIFEVDGNTTKTLVHTSQIKTNESQLEENDPVDDSVDEEEPMEVATVKDVVANAKIHYYKCRECNVCFVDESSCREHCTSHTALDPKLYIECKICNFQFLIDSLMTHVSRHHADEFVIDDLVITEYDRTEEGSLKIEVYQGMDKLQSGLVSTTTDAAESCEPDIIGI